MRSHLLKNTALKRLVSNFWKKRKGELIDIIAFGSAVRGNESPADLDLLLLFRDEVGSEAVYELRGMLEKGRFKADVLGKNWGEMLSSDFLAREGVLSEGVSLVFRKSLAEGFGYRSFVMFRYDMKGKSNTEVTKFYYALYGRKREGGFLKEVKGLKFTKNVILSQVENADKVAEFLGNWKMEFKRAQVLIPERTVDFVKF